MSTLVSNRQTAVPSSAGLDNPKQHYESDDDDTSSSSSSSSGSDLSAADFQDILLQFSNFQKTQHAKDAAAYHAVPVHPPQYSGVGQATSGEPEPTANAPIPTPRSVASSTTGPYLHSARNSGGVGKGHPAKIGTGASTQQKQPLSGAVTPRGGGGFQSVKVSNTLKSRHESSAASAAARNSSTGENGGTENSRSQSPSVHAPRYSSSSGGTQFSQEDGPKQNHKKGTRANNKNLLAGGRTSSAHSETDSNYSRGSSSCYSSMGGGHYLTPEQLQEKREARRRQVEREHCRDRTFTPRINNSSAPPERLTSVPLSGKGEWQDRLYTEYFYSKMRRKRESEAKFVDTKTKKELEEFVKECTFAPDTKQFHNKDKAVLKSYQFFERESRSGNKTCQVLYEAKIGGAESLTDAKAKEMLREQEEHERLQRYQIRDPEEVKPTAAQIRLYEEAEYLREKKRELEDKHFHEMQKHVEPVSSERVERMYDEARRRQEYLEEKRSEIFNKLHKSSTPKITRHQSQKNLKEKGDDVFTRLSSCVNLRHQAQLQQNQQQQRSSGENSPGRDHSGRGSPAKQPRGASGSKSDHTQSTSPTGTPRRHTPVQMSEIDLRLAQRRQQQQQQPSPQRRGESGSQHSTPSPSPRMQTPRYEAE